MSVGHVARAIEDAGIPTVTIMTRAFAHRASEMMIPRSLVVKHPLGYSMGAAFDTERHRDVLEAALEVLVSATAVGSIVEFAPAFRPQPEENIPT